MIPSSRIPVAMKLGIVVAMAITGSAVAGGGCGPGGHYALGPGGAPGIAGAPTESGGVAGHAPGSGGTGGFIGGGGVGGGMSAAGGAAGGGGRAGGGAGGTVTGGMGGSGGAATGGATAGNGGVSTGGMPSTGGMTAASGGRGGAASGGTGSGGLTGTGGVGSGGAMGGAGGAVRKILSIDFVGGIAGGGKNVLPTPMAATEMAGVKSVVNWNSAPMAASSAPLTPLLLNDGTSVGASVTWNAPGGPGASGTYNAGLTDMPGDVRMMNGYLDPAGPLPGGSANAATVTVSGLPASITTGGYDVYVYFLAQLTSGETRTHTLAIGTNTFTVSQTGPTSFSGYTLFDASMAKGNYVVFKRITGASFTLTATAVSGNIRRAPVNGIQIVWPSGS